MSKIKVNTIAPRSGTTVTLGEAGNTIALGACASQTGFGRTGTVDWCTTAKTSPFTAATGKGYFVNTCGGAVTVTLPASPTAGDIVSLKDYKNTWGTACKAVTLGRNSSKISGVCVDATLCTEGQVITMIYVDGTQGWLNTQTDTTIIGSEYICASGGNAIVTCGDYKTHIFTATGTFTVNCTALSAPNNAVDYLVVAGGAAGGGQGSGAGGGGAGGFRMSNALSIPAPTTSPLASPTGITVTATAYPITVGGGGAGSACSTGADGTDSVFSTITSTGGGGGGSYANPGDPGEPGGSGGGGGNVAAGSAAGGNGNDPPTNPAQGTNGGNGEGGIGPGSNPNHRQGGGGGGGGVQGTPATPSTAGAPGGAGSYIGDGMVGPTAPSYGTPGPVSNTRYFAGGGGGGVQGGSGPVTGTGGVGGGGDGQNPAPVAAVAGTVNTGGGGGGIVSAPTGVGGGSGIVMIRYKYQ